MKFILASASPRRRELLEALGLRIHVIPSGVEEQLGAGESPQEYVSRLAAEKAEEVARRHPEDWVIAADTVVYIDGRILEKPSDPADAKRMLATIAGREHEVFTGVALRRISPDHRDVRVSRTRVRMTVLSDQEIEWYVATGEPLDKAGAYAVQGVGAMFIESVDGNYTNVVGLPLVTLFGMMKEAGIHPLHLHTALE
ncbi:MAG: nucleoside triphosphate pyrophosphatase [Thermoanaerobaculia bacterium]